MRSHGRLIIKPKELNMVRIGKGEICLLGANERACFSVAKSLKILGYFITVIDSREMAIRFSKYVDKYIQLTANIERDIYAAKDEIIRYLSGNEVICLIPITDPALQFCVFFREQLEIHTTLLNVNRNESISYSTNKYQLLQAAKKLGIPVPKTQLIGTYDEFIRLKNDIVFPIIARPIQSNKILDGRILKFTVKKLYDPDTLDNFVREKINMTPLMLQEIIEGNGAGFNFLSVEGDVINSYSHERINEEYGGGQSTFRKSIPNSKFNLQQYSLSLVKEIKWNGIAMIEYKICSGKPYLMEINGRPWGSIEVGIKAGCDLPGDLVKVFIENQPVLQSSFKEVFVRNIYNETKWILKSKSPFKIIKWSLKLVSHVRKKYFIEDLVFSDFRFRSQLILDDIFRLGSRKKKFRKQFSLLPVFTKKELKDSESIAFLCKGNINRSAFAEWYLKTKNIAGIRILSFGTINEINRMCSVEATNIAKEFGVDLHNHRSKCIAPKILEELDKLIIMDEINLSHLHQLGIEDKNKIYKLEALPVKDPYGGELEDYRQCFSRIKTLLDGITG